MLPFYIEDSPIALDGSIEFFDIKCQIIGKGVGVVIMPIIFLLLFSRFYSIYHRLNKRKKNTYDVNKIEGPFILYLRSFSADVITKKRISFAETLSEEEALVEALSDIAPVYAIGDPKDKKMPIGASRVYVDDNHWRSTVASMAGKAAMVVLRLGKTDSFWWEVEMVLKSVPIDRILFIIPESKTFSDISLLYKILLEHNVNIHKLDIAIEDNNRGSISSFMFFDESGKPCTSQVKTGRFTQVFFKYTDVIRKSLVDLRAKFGLSSPTKTLRKATILQMLLILYLVFMGVMTTINTYLELKNKRPYEIVEGCIQNKSFVQKYSDQINDTTLLQSIYEAQQGIIALSDEDYRTLILIETKTMMQISASELECLFTAPYNILLMIMKYMPNDYNAYINLMAKAALLSIQNPEHIKDLYSSYIDVAELPEWFVQALNEREQCQDKYHAHRQFYTTLYDHIDDSDIIVALKISNATMQSAQ